MRIPDHLTCLLRNLCAGEEASVRTRHGTKDWFKIGKGVHQGCYWHPAYVTYMQSTSQKKAGLDETQAGNTIAGRKINNVRCANVTTLMAKSKEELKSPLMKIKQESEKAGLKLNIQKTKI